MKRRRENRLLRVSKYNKRNRKNKTKSQPLTRHEYRTDLVETPRCISRYPLKTARSRGRYRSRSRSSWRMRADHVRVSRACHVQRRERRLADLIASGSSGGAHGLRARTEARRVKQRRNTPRGRSLERRSHPLVGLPTPPPLPGGWLREG